MLISTNLCTERNKAKSRKTAAIESLKANYEFFVNIMSIPGQNSI